MGTHFRSTQEDLAARDMDACLSFYRDKLGFAGVVCPDRPPYWYARLYRDGALLMIYNVTEYLKAATHGEEPATPVLRTWPPFRLLFPVGDLQALRAELGARGLSTGGVEAGGTGGRQLEVVDPDGNTVVFSEGPEESARDAG